MIERRNGGQNTDIVYEVELELSGKAVEDWFNAPVCAGTALALRAVHCVLLLSGSTVLCVQTLLGHYVLWH